MKPFNSFVIFCFAAVLLIFDRWLKLIAIKQLSSGSFFIVPGFGLEIFNNKKFLGIISLPDFLGIGLMIIFLTLLFILLRKEMAEGKTMGSLALAGAVSGAISNTADRLIAGSVIDYLVIGPSVINLSDILITGGIMLYLVSRKND